MEKVGTYIKAYIKGKTPKELVVNNTGNLLPYLSPDYLRNISEPEFYCKTIGKGIHINEGEVLILWDGSNAGEVFISKEGILASTMTMLKIEKNDFDKKYFAYTFKNLEYYLKSKTAGSGIPHADKGVIKKLAVFKPSLKEQKTIADIIGKVDQSIENVQKTINATQKLKKSLMQNLLTGRMKPDGTMRKDNEFYEHPKLGKVPIGWDVKQIKDIALQVTDGEHQTPKRTETGYYLLSARNIKNGYLELSDVDYVDEEEFNRIKKRCHPEENDILISCSGTIGNVSKVPAGIDCVMVRSAALVKVNHKKINSSFLEYLLQSYPLQTAMKVAVSASVQGNLFQGAIKKLRFIAPADIKEQENISLVFDSITEIIKTKQNKKNVLLRLKKSLMQNLLTGKKRVDVNKINALLESIK